MNEVNAAKEEAKRNLSPAESMTVLKRALLLSLKVKGAWSLTVSIAGFFAAFLPVVIARYLEQLTNRLQSYALSPAQEQLQRVLLLFAVLMGLQLLQEIYNGISAYAARIDRVRTRRHIERTVMECKCRAAYHYIENDEGFRQKLSLIQEYAGEQTAKSMQAILLMAQLFLTLCSVSAELFRVSGGVVVLLWATCIPAAWLAWRQSDDTYRFRTKWMPEGNSVIKQFIACVRPEAMKDIRHFHAYDYLKGEWRRSASVYIDKKEALTKKHVRYNVAADVLRNGVYLAILVIAAKRIYREPQLGLGAFMLVLTLSSQLQKVMTGLLVSAVEFGQNINYMKDFFDLQQLCEADIPAEPLARASIRFENVSFAYPGAERNALNGLSVCIEDGETIAIVGENGSGKSTFVNLLFGFYPSSGGRIFINEQAMAGAEAAGVAARLRKSSAVVFQDFCHYEASIRENITVSDRERTIDEAEFQELLTKSNLREVADAQPHGVDEEIGQFSATGNNLSGGQWQRIALARALYRRDSRLMVLDEPTSALDPLAEAELYRRFAEMAEGKTTLLISYRLGITRLVKRILVFHEGRIVEDGDHETLMRKGGCYAKMYRAQAQWYQK